MKVVLNNKLVTLFLLFIPQENIVIKYNFE